MHSLRRIFHWTLSVVWTNHYTAGHINLGYFAAQIRNFLLYKLLMSEREKMICSRWVSKFIQWWKITKVYVLECIFLGPIYTEEAEMALHWTLSKDPLPFMSPLLNSQWQVAIDKNLHSWHWYAVGWISTWFIPSLCRGQRNCPPIPLFIPDFSHLFLPD